MFNFMYEGLSKYGYKRVMLETQKNIYCVSTDPPTRYVWLKELLKVKRIGRFYYWKGLK